MKKGKLLSVLTSLAMTGTMVLSAVPFTASAANNLGLKMTSAKTEYSLAEIQAGARAKVYVDIDGSISESDNIKCVEADLVPTQWGTVDPINLQLSDKNALASSYGDSPYMDECFNGMSTMAVSQWDTSYDSDCGYTIIENDETNEKNVPKFIVATDSNLGFLRAGSGEHIAEFEVAFPKDLKDGKYTINFANAHNLIYPDGILGRADTQNVASATGITFTVGSGSETESPTTQGGDPSTIAPKEYDGTATLSLEKNVKGTTDELVNVPLYISLDKNADPQSFDGFVVDFKYDTSALDLVAVKKPKQVGLEGGTSAYVLNTNLDGDRNTVNIMLQGENSVMVNDPTKPLAVLQFEVKSGASGTYPIKIESPDGDKIEIVHFGSSAKTTYFEPVTEAGSIVVGSEGVSSNDNPLPVADKVYDGTATLSLENNVKGVAGETVNVPLYISLDKNADPQSFDGFTVEFKYDTTALDLVAVKKPKQVGLEGGTSAYVLNTNLDGDRNTVNIMLQGENSVMVNDPTKPLAVLQFEVKDGATGTYPIKIESPDGDKIEIVHFGSSAKTTYFEPATEAGSIVVGSEGSSDENKNTIAPKVYDGTAKLKLEKNVKGEVGETVNVPLYISLDSAADPQSFDGFTVEFKYDTTALDLVAVKKPKQVSMEGGTSAYVLNTNLDGDRNTVNIMLQGENSITVDDPTKPLAVLQFEVKDGATGTYPIKIESPDGDKIEIVHFGSSAKTTYFEPATEAGSIVVGGSANEDGVVEIDTVSEIDGQNAHWYFADHDEWNLDGIEVTVGGEAQEVSLDDLTFTVNGKECKTPGDAYDGKTFNYEVTVVYKDYTDQPATFDAKIGQRGDANLDHKVKANDCAYIAKDLAQKATGKTTMTKEDGFGIFLGNADGKVDPKWKIKIYQPYCLDVTDAAKIAQFLARVRGEKSLTLYDVVVLKK